ncbi:amino acid adenylation domain-containing protein [Saccharothrix sp. NPDC042600]|uniref:CmnF n=1 Tax=Saccharothrix mutabilis subsp. capreolus TaxID=66854 RepID=A6YEH7_STRMP|nr:CmnF [Saccharothrix mutabilis subsp. capreolus]
MTQVDFTRWDLRTDAEKHATPTVLSGPPPAWSPDTTLARLVLDQADRTPDADAVRIGPDALTYRELAAGARRVAAWVARQPHTGPPRVGVLGERSLATYPVLLGVLLAGGAYVPLDPAAPPARLRAVLSRADAHAVVTTAESWALLEQPGLPALLTDQPLPFQRSKVDSGRVAVLAGLPDAGEPVGPTPDDVAYVIFTSGSTGTPKGVVVQHRAAVNLTCWARDLVPMGPGSRVTQNASLHFDASVQQIFPALASGATLFPVPERVRLSGPELAAWLARHRITHWDSVPSLWTPVVEHLADRIAAGQRVLPDLRAVLLAGEPLPARQVDRWRSWEQGHRLFNVYGPTEVTVNATAFEVTGPVGAVVPIGRPLPGITASVLDAHGNPCPVDADGELFLGGVGLARGYLDDPEGTARSFVERGGERFYRTGDVVRVGADGLLVFVGRRDDQVKLNGVRVEPAEIEHALLAHPGVTEAVAVVLREEGRAELVACVASAVELSTEDIRAGLAEELPAALVPSRVVVVESLPHNANGKLDRAACAELARDLSGPSGGAGPLGATAATLLGIWRSVLGRDDIGPDDEFFQVGGNSITSIRLRRECVEAGLPIRAVDVFLHPTVRRLARYVDDNRTTLAARARPAPEESPTDGEFPLLPAQRPLALTALLSDGGAQRGLVQETVTYRVPLDVDAVRGALEVLLERHEVLRTAVTPGLAQRVLPKVPVPLEVVDLTGVADQWGAVLEAADRDYATPFDLAEPPLVRVRAFDRGEVFSLTWTLHHVISDGWSWEIVQREFDRLHVALRAGRFRPLPPPVLPLRALARRLGSGGTPDPEWVARLAATPALLLPADGSGVGGEHIEWPIDPGTHRELAARAQAAEASPAAIHLLAFTEALRRVCRQDSFAVGVVSSGRNVDVPGVEEAVACLARTVPLPVDAVGGAEARLARLHRDLAVVVGMDDVDTDVLPADVPAGVRHPVATFVFQNYPDAAVPPGHRPLPEVPEEGRWREAGSDPLALVCFEDDGVPGCRLEFDTAAVSRATAELVAREVRRAQNRLAKGMQP